MSKFMQFIELTQFIELFDMGVLLQICCIFSEQFFLMTPLDGCFCCIPTLPNKSFILCELKLDLIHNCCLFAKYVLFVFFLLQFKPSTYYFLINLLFSLIENV